MKILLIDDEARIRKAFARTLKFSGYAVITAEDGEAGLALFDSEQPDIVLLDLRMPGMDGLTVLRKMRHRDPEANVILCTGHGDKDAVIAALRAGASDFLSKPIDHVALESALRRTEERIALKRKLRASEEALRQQNAHLDELVRARTAELEREVEERKSVQKKLQQTLVQLEGIKRYTPDLLTMINRDGRYLMVNQAVAQFLEQPLEEIVGKTFSDILPPRVADLFMTRLERVFASEEPLEVEEKIPQADGESVYATILFPLFDQDGCCYAVGGIARDITERKQAEDALRESEGKLRTLLNATEQAFVLLDCSGAILTFNRVAQANAQAMFGFPMRVGDSIERFVREGDQDFAINFARAVAGDSVTIEKQLPTPDGQTRWFAFTYHPVLEEGQVTGIGFNTVDITTRKQVEEALRMHQQLTATITNPLAFVSSEYHYRIVNEVYADFYGVPPREIIGHAITDFADQDVFEAQIKPHLDRCLAGEVVRYEVTVDFPGKGPRWMRMEYFPYHDASGAIVGVVSHGQDVTERKQAEEELRESEEKYRRLVEGSPDIVYIYSDKHGALYWSQRVQNILGIAPADLIEHPYKWHDAIHPDDVVAVDKAILESHTGKGFEIEYRIQDSNDNWHWFHDRFISKYQRGDEFIIEGLATDITVRKQAEDALRENQARYQRAQQIGHVGNWEYNLQTTAFWGSEEAKRIYGFDPTTDRFTTEDVEDCIPDRENVHQALVDLIERDKEYRLEFDIITQDTGERRTISSIAELEKDADGNPLKVTGVIQDITARKQIEEALYNSEAKFRAITEQMLDTVFLTDTQGVITYISPVAEALFNVAPAKMLGRPFAAFLTAEDTPKAMAAFEHFLATGEPNEDLELWMRRKDGSAFLGELKATLFYQDGHVTGTIGLIRDVTARKQAEDALRESEARLRAIGDNLPAGQIYQLRMAPDGSARFTYVSAAVEQLHECTVEEALNDVSVLFNRVVEEDVPAWMTATEKAVQEMRTYDHTLRIRRNSGEIRWHRMISKPRRTPDGALLFDGLDMDITARKQAEDALRESEEKLRCVVENSTNLFYEHTPDHILTYLSPQTRPLLDCEPEEALIHWTEFVTDNPINDVGFALTEKAIATGETQPPYELELMGKRGRKIWVEVREVPVVEAGQTVAIVGSLTDVTDRKQAEDALRESRDAYEKLFRFMTGCFLRADAQGYITLANVAAADVFGYASPEAMLGIHITQLYAYPEERDAILQEIKEQGSLKNYEIRLRTREGQFFWALCNIKVIVDEHGDVLGTEGLIRDITERKQAQASLERIEWLLDKSLDPVALQPAYRPPYGDVTKLNTCRVISDAVDRDALRRLAEDTIDLLDTSVAVYEKNGDYAFGMFSSGWCQFMDAASRQLCGDVDNCEALTCGCWLCHENCWHDSAQVAIETGQPTDIACVGGIHLYAVPIFAGDAVVGAINIGYGDPPRDAPTLEKLAADFGVSVAELETQARAYQTRPAYIIALAKKRLHTIAALIGERVERKQMEAALRESESRARALLEAIPDLMFRLNRESIFLDYKAAHAELYAQDVVTLIGKRNRDLTPAAFADLVETYIERTLTSWEMQVFNYQLPVPEKGVREYEARMVPSGPDEVTTIVRDITERQQAEAVIEALAKFPSENPNPVLRIAGDGTVLYANAASATLLQVWGYREAQLVPDDWQAVIAETLATNRGQSIETLCGAQTLALTFAPVVKADYVNVYGLDVTERKQGEETLRVALRLAQQMEATTIDDLIAWGLEEAVRLTRSAIGYCHFINPDQETIALHTWSANTRKACTARRTPHYPLAQAGIWADCIRQNKPVIHNDYASAPGRKGLPEGHVPVTRHVSVPVKQGETIVAVMGVGNKPQAYTQTDVDILTQLANVVWLVVRRKQAEAQIQEYANHLEQLVEEKVAELEREHTKIIQMDKMSAIGQMATGVAHELNQPLTAITFDADYLKTAAQKLKTDPASCPGLLIPDELIEMGENFMDDVARCRRIVDHLRTLGRTATGALTPISLEKPISDSLILTAARLREHGIDVRLDFTDDLPPILADPHKLEQVFLNLIANAEYAMEKQRGGNHPRVLEIATYCEDDHVIATVRDNGCGIPDEVRAHLFEPFYTTKPEGEGTGLGLSISYDIVTEFAGEITCESIVGEGTTFKLRFPTVDPPEVATNPQIFR